MIEPKIEQGITQTGVTHAIALTLTFYDKFFEDFKDKYGGMENCTYRDVVIIWNGVEYSYSMKEFKRLLKIYDVDVALAP